MLAKKKSRWLQAPLGKQGQNSVLAEWERTKQGGKDMLFLDFQKY